VTGWRKTASAGSRILGGLLGLSLVLGAATSAARAGAADEHKQAARAAAGQTWQRAYEYLCEGKDRVFNAESDPPIAPRWLFDDLGVLGDRNTVLYVLKTADGVVLFDTGYASKTAAVLQSGLKALGVDPKQIKTVLITHGHPDHYGGAAYLQNTVGPTIWAGSADWPGIAASGVSRGKDAVDGGEIEQGGVTIRTFAVPGHTPGALGFIFPVHENGKMHAAALMGGLILGLERATPEALRQYISSLERFRAASDAARVDVELENHPVFDNFAEKLARIDSPRRGSANPFIVGAPAYSAFLSVNQACAAASLADR